MAGKTAEYAVTLLEIKQRVLPPLDDAFAAKWMPDKTLADLRHALEHQIEHEKEHELESGARIADREVSAASGSSSSCRRICSKHETRNALAELVHRNRERGVPDEMLKEKEEELIRGGRRPGRAPA